MPDHVLKRRYYLSMLSLAVLILIFNAVYFVLHQSFQIFLMTSVVQILMYAGLNFVGAFFLYKPVVRILALKETGPAARTKINRLPWHSARWVLIIGGLYVAMSLSFIFLFPVQIDEYTMGHVPLVLLWTFAPSLIFVYAIFPAFIAYFLINDFNILLRTKVHRESGLIFAAGKRSKIGLTLLLVFVVLGVIPSLLVILDLVAVAQLEEAYAEFMDAMHISPLGTVLVDRFVVLVGLIFAVVLITRGFTKPIYALLDEIKKVRAGDFSTQAPVTTIDEIGVLTTEFNDMVKGLEERERIRDTFGRYVTRDVANIILDKTIDVSGEIRPCTILVTDIENYTAIAENLSPTEVVAMLNEYFSVLMEIIQRNNGTVNKLIGDSIFALFNVPSDDPNHAVNAIRAALEIERLTSERTFGKGHILPTRIGINTGDVVAGNLGSADRMEYTVIGDDVNIAARLEQLNKDYGTRILLGENTYHLTKSAFEFRELGAIQLKGKERPTKVYELMDQESRTVNTQ